MPTLFWFPFHPSPVFSQWHVKVPGHSTKSAGDGSQIDTHIPFDSTKSRLGRCCCPGIAWRPNRNTSSLVKECSSTVISARWATVDWFWRKVWNLHAQAYLHFKTNKQKQNKQKKKSAGKKWFVEPSPKILAREECKLLSSSPLYIDLHAYLAERRSCWSVRTLDSRPRGWGFES